MEAGAKDLEIAEKPITYHPREGEANLESFPDGWRHVRFMLVNAPGYLFSRPGSVVRRGSVGAVIARLSIGGVNFGIRRWSADRCWRSSGSVWTLALFSSIAANPIIWPEGVLVGMIREQLRWAGAPSAGSGRRLPSPGACSARWLLAGDAALLSATATLLASTVVVLGLRQCSGRSS
ncbi:hypothetical protein C9J85_05195 [Haloferax sp. wsp5]|nr:hypothetical protein C9J85_05195 [Haloferax sp. wsp5]